MTQITAIPEREAVTIMKKGNLAQYVNLKEVASGSHSQVYTARDSTTNKEVVIKKLGKEHFPLHRVENEVRALTELASIPAVVDFYGAFETSSSFWLVFNRLQGVDLFAFMEENDFQPLDEDFARELFSTLANAFSQIHDKGIAHKDIKLENIMFDQKTKKTTIIDFGLCELFKGRKTKSPSTWLTDDFSGSLEYIAPEIVVRKPYQPKKADVWSLGVTLYTLLFGEFPLQLTDMSGILEAKQQREKVTFKFPEGKKQLSVELIDLLSNMIEIEPQKRLSMADVASHPWLRNREERSL